MLIEIIFYSSTVIADKYMQLIYDGMYYSSSV